MDGQNLFYDSTSYVGEWAVDESMDSLIGSGLHECIIVGIDHGTDKRISEYNPFDHPRFGKGEGRFYVQWLVDTLIPEIESAFRIKKENKFRSIGGSSMGGLISLYAISRYPDIFGSAALFSISFPIAPQSFSLLDSLTPESKIYIATGGKEGGAMISGVTKADSILRTNNYPESNFEAKIIPEMEHNETFWTKQFIEFYKWISETWVK